MHSAYRSTFTKPCQQGSRFIWDEDSSQVGRKLPSYLQRHKFPQALLISGRKSRQLSTSWQYRRPAWIKRVSSLLMTYKLIFLSNGKRFGMVMQLCFKLWTENENFLILQILQRQEKLKETRPVLRNLMLIYPLSGPIPTGVSVAFSLFHYIKYTAVPEPTFSLVFFKVIASKCWLQTFGIR